MSGRNLGASIRDRLLNKARAEKLDYNLLLTRYALERMIYRLSISAERDRFLLKGALLFDLWFDVPHRPTHDADFLGFGSAEIPQVEAVFRDICRIEVDDGIVFDPNSVKAAEIRKEANYAGVRVTLLGMLDKARCPVQADIGFGDAVVPGPDEVDYPVLLAEMPAPHLRVYPRYTVVAEKLEALTSLGMLNSRMKDYFDLWVLVRYSEFDMQILIRAVAATFERRQTRIPNGVPVGLSDEFANDSLKEKQWNAFLQKNSIAPKPLSEVVTDLRDILMPVLSSAVNH
ncbi:MAG: nucleotidyl transferase AbiEii/AbiGii toxin family protein [Rhodocyclales bacterium]|nr:nucleotidyl transferase AbiEii/AbiGii toxin family protein [Rhodocyclales bacterium]